MGAVLALRTLFKKLPTTRIEANAEMRAYLRTQLESTPFVYGALFYGSGDPESDIDYLVVYLDEARDAAHILETGLADFAETKGIPLDGRWLSYSEAESEVELFKQGLSYYLHLLRASKRWDVIKRDPTSVMPFFDGDWVARLRKELESYLKTQLAVVQTWTEQFKALESQTIPEQRSREKCSDYSAILAEQRLFRFLRDNLYQYLEGVIGVPGHVMRKVVELQDIALENDLQEVIRPRYLLLTDPATRHIAEQLITLKVEYRKVAQRTDVTRKEYVALLRRIEREGSALLEQFLTRTLHWLAEKESE